jgi:nitroreductase
LKPSGWRRRPATANLGGWPKTIKPAAVITVGYPVVPVPDAGATPSRKSVEKIVQWM